MSRSARSASRQSRRSSRALTGHDAATEVDHTADRSLERVLSDASRALVLGMGGGGDVVGALSVLRLCQSFGCAARLGGVSWERLPIDPHPGPRTLEEILGARPLNHCVALADSGTTTPDGTPFSESLMASFLCQDTVLVDPSPGPEAIAAGIDDACRRLGCDLVCAVDIGGDVLGRGDEPSLASPLCDAVMLAALARCEVPGMLAVAGPGADGELTPDEVLERSAELAAGGAWLGAWGVTPDVATQIEAAAAKTRTEASLNLARCARGERGTSYIRGGRRSVHLSPLGAVVLCFDPQAAVRAGCPLARAVAGASSLRAADDALTELGVHTELGYERRELDG